MGRRQDGRPRILGPTWIESKARWRVLVITPEAHGRAGRRSARWFVDEAEAVAFVEAVTAKLSKLSTVTVAQAIDGYADHLKARGTIGYSETIRRLRLFFHSLALALSRVTPERAEAYYETFRKRERPDGNPISVSYHRAALINARSLCKWGIKQGWIASNPFAAVEGIGKRSSGKPQLTGDEIRTLYGYCFKRAGNGDDAALGVLMALLMALRSADLCRRVVRDVDLDCTALRVTGGKTRKSNRPRRIPAELQPMVARLIAGKSPDAPLFATPYTDSGHHTRRWLEEAMRRFCAACGVPYVPPHSLKGAAGTIQAEMGDDADRIARHLSHESPATTMRHYVDAGAFADAAAAKALKVITGGKGRKR